jgi:dolichol-phosphate mannosyltransferase
MAEELSIVVPVLNEAKNLSILVDRLSETLNKERIDWEVVFVDDDSQDGSRAALIDLANQNSRVRFITRIGRQGLSSAAIEGMLSSSARHLAVMDGDLQHDETLLPKMLVELQSDEVEVVVGSRFAKGASLGEFSSTREKISNLGNWLARLTIKTELKDPLNGFFMIKREAFEPTLYDLSGTGFKILVDILASSPRPLKVKELGFNFGKRIHGESKIDSLVAVEFLTLLAEKWLGFLVPVRFLFFTAVGGLGVFIHLAILSLLFKTLGWQFYSAQATATLLTMAINFSLNNVLTYRDRRLSGFGFIKGLLSFYLVCSVGALANFQFAEFLFSEGIHWILAGLAGAIVGAVWNYAMTSTFTWAKKKKQKI